ncbi:ascc3 [Symbiodinium sp. KB8]|nr:ascc3 [Symbiodinium sp. KB8]
MPFSYSSVMEFAGSSCTALHAAVAWSRPEVCSLLLHHSRFSAVGEQNGYWSMAMPKDGFQLGALPTEPEPVTSNTDGAMPLNLDMAVNPWMLVLGMRNIDEPQGEDFLPTGTMESIGNTFLNHTMEDRMTLMLAIHRLVLGLLSAVGEAIQQATRAGPSSEGVEVEVEEPVERTRQQVDFLGHSQEHTAQVTTVLATFAGDQDDEAGGQTALHMAVLNGETDLVAELLEDGRIDATARTQEGFTALELALLIRVELSCYGGCRGKYDKILALLLQRSDEADSVNVLSVALATFDKPLEQVALSCLRSQGKFMAGVHVGNGRLDATQCFRTELALKEDRWRKKFVQKQKEFSRKQHVAAKQLRNRKSSEEDEQPIRRPVQPRAKAARAEGADDWQIYR